MRLLNGLKTLFDPDRGARNMAARRTHEPFTWHSADPQSYGKRLMFVALLCVLCGSAGYLAGRSGVDPDRVPAKIRTTSQTTVAPASSNAVSEVPSKLDRSATEAVPTTDNRSSFQTIASKTDVPPVVLLNPNSTNKAELSEHKSGPSAATIDSQRVNTPTSAEPMRKKQKVFHSRRQDRSLAEKGRALNDGSAPRRVPPRNALSTRHDDNAYRDYRDLREFMLR